VQLINKIGRLLRPEVERPDHPLTGQERVDEATHSDHVWTEAQNIGGANSWGRADVEHDFKGP
jgi:hypothetical protein